MSTQLEYIKLQPDEIRLIRMIDDVPGRVAYELSVFPLAITPEYTALSHRWGEPARTIEIIADGKVLRITNSLNDFLGEVVSRRRSASQKTGWSFRWFWIDAVCINQDDAVERGEQVAKMKEIYEKAEHMVIWLGEADSGTSDAFDMLEEVAELECETFKLMDGAMPGISCKLGSDESSVDMLYETLNDDIGGILWSGYWNRAWIIQEASTPKDSLDSGGNCKIWVCCGGFTLAWDVLAEANKRLLAASWDNEVEVHAYLHGVANGDIATLKYIQDRRKAQTFEESLYPMLIRSRTSGATDARDKVYAIAGLVKTGGDHRLQPNYTLSVEDVYIQAAKAIVESSQSLDSLGSAGLPRDHNVPSWTPDWTVQHNTVPQPFYLYDQLWSEDGSVRRTNLFNASEGAVPQISFDRNDRCLVARGFCFDTLTTLSVPRTRSSADLPSDDRWRNWTETANPDQAKYVAGCTRLEAFKKVLKADVSEVWGDWSAERGSTIEGFHHPSQNAFDFQDAILDAMTWTRRLFVTRKGYLGLGPSTLEEHDVLCVLFGSQMPLVLRRQGGDCLFVGRAYVHGLMDGEAIDMSDRQHDEVFSVL